MESRSPNSSEGTTKNRFTTFLHQLEESVEIPRVFVIDDAPWHIGVREKCATESVEISLLILLSSHQWKLSAWKPWLKEVIDNPGQFLKNCAWRQRWPISQNSSTRTTGTTTQCEWLARCHTEKVWNLGAAMVLVFSLHVSTNKTFWRERVSSVFHYAIRVGPM